MPDPRDGGKAGGESRPTAIDERERKRPETERARDDPALEDEARPGKGENQAGFLKDTEGG